VSSLRGALPHARARTLGGASYRGTAAAAEAYMAGECSHATAPSKRPVLRQQNQGKKRERRGARSSPPPDGGPRASAPTDGRTDTFRASLALRDAGGETTDRPCLDQLPESVPVADDPPTERAGEAAAAPDREQTKQGLSVPPQRIRSGQRLPSPRSQRVLSLGFPSRSSE
jgi:hypothetical protein